MSRRSMGASVMSGMVILGKWFEVGRMGGSKRRDLEAAPFLNGVRGGSSDTAGEAIVVYPEEPRNHGPVRPSV